MENKYTLYMHKNKINDKKYIGITKQKPEYRWSNGKGYIHNHYFYSSIQKYGWNEGFEHIILQNNLTQQEACQLEKQLIKSFDTTNPDKGYNLCEGGIQTGPLSFEKMIEWQNTHKKFGKDNVNSKKVKCIETGDVFGSINEACRWCNSTKVGDCCRGYREHAGRHPETGERLSWKYANEDEEVTIICNIKQYEDKKKKNLKILCVETNEIFNNEAEACNAYNITRGNINRVCSGKRKTAQKKHWKWITEDDND